MKQTGLGGWAAVPGDSRLTVTSDGIDLAVACRNFTNNIVRRVSDVQVSIGVKCHAKGRIQPGLNRRTSIASVSARAPQIARGTAGDRRQAPARLELADPIVASICDVKISRAMMPAQPYR